MTIKTATATVAVSGEGEFSVSCDAGQKVSGGGFSSDGGVFALDSFPASDSVWRFYLANLSSSSGANITLYATCLR